MASEVILKALPFDSREVINQETGEKEYDRVAYSADLANWMKTYFSNGVLVPNGGTISTELQVTASGLTVTVNPGAICINGRTAWVDEATQLTVNMGGSSVRYDRIVAELNLPEDRQIALKVVEGTTNPPSLVRTGDVYQMSLAQVRVNANAAVIASVIDERQDESVCGISNVMVGVKIPSGDSAENIGVSDEVAGIYRLTGNNKNVEKALIAIPDTLATSSYIAFCTKANTNSVESAMGKNNEDFVRGIGKALALYARFQNPDLDLETDFPNLISKGSLAEIFDDAESLNEVVSNADLYSFLNSFPYSQAYLQDETSISKAVARYMGFNDSQYNSYSKLCDQMTLMLSSLESKPAALGALTAFPAFATALNGKAQAAVSAMNSKPFLKMVQSSKQRVLAIETINFAQYISSNLKTTQTGLSVNGGPISVINHPVLMLSLKDPTTSGGGKNYWVRFGTYTSDGGYYQNGTALWYQFEGFKFCDEVWLQTADYPKSNITAIYVDLA